MHRRSARARLAAAAAAATALVLCCATASPALAAGKPAKVSKVVKAKVKDPLAASRKQALAAITVDTKRLTVVAKAGSVSQVLTADEQDALSTATVLQGVALRDDRVAVGRAKTRKQIAAAVAGAQRTLAAAALELSVSVAAETHLAGGQQAGDDADTLASEAQDAAAAGEDTTDVTTDLDSVQVDLESAQGDEASTCNDVMGLPSAPSAGALKAAAANARTDLALVDQDLSDANDDLAAAQAAYDALGSGGGTDPGTVPGDPGDGS